MADLDRARDPGDRHGRASRDDDPCVRLWCHDFADGVALPVPLESMAISSITRAIPDNLSDLVGCTPLVRLGRLAPGCDAELVGKLEAYNPAGSVKEIGRAHV